MANKHVNGDNPYRMTVSQAAKEIDNWVKNGGQMRIDGPHQGNEEVHAHLYVDNKPSEDLLIQIESDSDLEPDPEPDSEPESESDSDPDPASDDD